MTPRRRRYGQHFLVCDGVAGSVSRACGATKNDTVLEIGTGTGVLTEKLCGDGGRVVSVESDPALYEEAARRLGHLPNLTLRCGDGFRTDLEFDVFASNLPYSQSRRAVEWLASKTFRCGAIMVQDEFASKVTLSGAGRRAVSVVWQGAFRVVRSFAVGPDCFAPPPRVKSAVLAFEKTDTLPRHTILKLHRLFSRRRKVLYRDPKPRRLEELSAGQILEIARTPR